MTLIHCGNKAPFQAQVQALSNLLNVVGDSFQGGEIVHLPKIGLEGIKLERPVFTRVCRKMNQDTVQCADCSLAGKERGRHHVCPDRYG